MIINNYIRKIFLSFIILSLFVSTYSQNKPDSTNYYLKLETGKVIYGNLEYNIPYIGGDYVRVNDTSYYIPDIKSFNCSWGYFAKFQLDSLSDKVEIFKRTKKEKSTSIQAKLLFIVALEAIWVQWHMTIKKIIIQRIKFICFTPITEI